MEDMYHIRIEADRLNILHAFIGELLAMSAQIVAIELADDYDYVHRARPTLKFELAARREYSARLAEFRVYLDAVGQYVGEDRLATMLANELSPDAYLDVIWGELD